MATSTETVVRYQKILQMELILYYITHEAM
jgi:hypothetical protein